MKTGKTQKPLFFAIVLLFAMTSALKLSDIVQLRRKLHKMESEGGILPEGRKLAEAGLGSLKDFDKVSAPSLQTHKKSAGKAKAKATKVRKAQKKAPVKKAAKKRQSQTSQRKLNSIDAQANLAPQAPSQVLPPQVQDNGILPAKYEKVSQKLQPQNFSQKNVRNQNASLDRSLKSYKSHSKRRHRVAATRVHKNHRKAITKSAHRKHRRAATHKKSTHRKNKGHANLNKRKHKKSKKNVKAKKLSKKKHRQAAGKVKKVVAKKALKVKPQAKKLRDLPVNNKENEKLALDAINANAATPQQKEAPKMTERKLLDLPSQNEFYEQIVSNYYPTI